MKDQDPDAEDIEQYMIELEPVEDNVLDDFAVWMVELNQEEDIFEDFMGFSDFQDEFPMGAKWNSNMDEGIEVILSHNDRDFGD